MKALDVGDMQTITPLHRKSYKLGTRNREVDHADRVHRPVACR